MDVINKEFLTAGGFRWFLSSYTPTKENFIVDIKSCSSDKVFNSYLWKTFDLYGKKYVVINKSKSFWDIDIARLSLHSLHSVLKGKI